MTLLRTLAVLLVVTAATAAHAQGVIPANPGAVMPNLPAIPAPGEDAGVVTIVQLPHVSARSAECMRVQNCSWNPAAQKVECLRPSCAR